MAGVGAPITSIDEHYPTGRAKITLTFWMTEEERTDLLDRIMAEETLVHDREKMVNALELKAEQ